MKINIKRLKDVLRSCIYNLTKLSIENQELLKSDEIQQMIDTIASFKTKK